MLRYNEYTMILGVALSIGVVALLVWYVNSVIPRELGQREWLTRFVALVLTAQGSANKAQKNARLSLFYLRTQVSAHTFTSSARR